MFVSSYYMFTQGGGELLEDKVVCIARWRGEHNNNAYAPMLEQTHERRVKWLV